MDQDSSNGSVNDKRNWRERLGIGSKDMPKLSDEFKTERVPPTLSKASSAQPVAKPAPMAPRPAAGTAPAAPRVAPAAPRVTPAPAAAPAQAAQQSALAEKLRAQRDAAEKLAAQRVNAARERAEARQGTAEPRLPVGRSQGSEKPKFSFADEAPPPPPAFQPRSSGLGTQPLAPPRPALGGERMPPLPPRGLNQPGNGFRQDQPPPYRPIDPATGYPGATQRGGYAPPPRSSFGAAPAPGAAVARRPSYEPPRPHYDDHYGAEEEYPADPRLSRSMAKARQQPMAGEADDVFEDAPAPRRRASAADYNAAYREAEETYEEPAKRSSGPWLLLLALLLAAVATGGIVWFYQTKMKPQASNATTTGEQVPVVEAPAEPAKTVPEAPIDQGAQPATTTSKKQIYDRIVGDQEVRGDQVVPTEQPPVQPEPAAAGQDAAQPLPEPAGGTGGNIIDDAAPLPLPPPPGDNGAAPAGNTQGSLDSNQIQPASTQAAGDSLASTNQGAATGTQAPPSTSQTASDTTAAAVTPPPAPEPGATATAEPLEAITDSDAPASPPAAKPKAGQIAANDAGDATAEAPAKKPATQKKSKTKTAKPAPPQQDLGASPVVLVPPSQDAGDTILAPSQDAGAASLAASGQGSAPQAQPVQKRKTIFDLFKNKNEGTTTAQTATPPQSNETVEPVPQEQPQQQPQKKVAAVQPPAQQSTGGSGYVAQLASFRTQAEAQSEYSRLRSKYPAIVGALPPTISTATVAGSTRYRLGLGPLGSREDASRVCGSLLASGERDCIVRKQ